MPELRHGPNRPKSKAEYNGIQIKPFITAHPSISPPRATQTKETHGSHGDCHHGEVSRGVGAYVCGVYVISDSQVTPESCGPLSAVEAARAASGGTCPRKEF